MTDFTKGRIALHLFSTAAPLTLSTSMQMAYPLIDVYFLSEIGSPAVAGVSAAGNAMFAVTALSQVLVVGTVALVAHAVGRSDRRDANLIFNQSLGLSAACGLMVAIFLAVCARPYMELVSLDPAAINAGTSYIFSVLPGYALLLPMGTLSCALRATGNVHTSATAYALTVVANTILAPVLIAGWGTGVALGVRGAGLGTSVAVLAGMAFLCLRFHRQQPHMAVNRELLWPRSRQWSRILAIGLPSGAEFALMFLSTVVVYYVIRDLGTPAQAGFGIGYRMLQFILVPAAAVAAVVGPIAGQNFGAMRAERVRETFRAACFIGMGVTLAIALILRWQTNAFVGMFDADPDTVEVAALFLKLMSWALVAQCFVNICLGMFQGLGNTAPALISSAIRFFAFSIPALWLPTWLPFGIEHVCYLSIAAIAGQAIVSWWLLRAEFRDRLPLIEQKDTQCLSPNREHACNANGDSTLLHDADAPRAPGIAVTRCFPRR